MIKQANERSTQEDDRYSPVYETPGPSKGDYAPISFRETFRLAPGGVRLKPGILAIREAGGRPLYSCKAESPLTSTQLKRQAMDIKNLGRLIFVETAEGHKKRLRVDPDIAAKI